MTDRYVIVYRNGKISSPDETITWSNRRLKLLFEHMKHEYRPAYRIRIREKANKPRVNPLITDWRQLMSIAAPDETGV
jgi:hypothetical protein